jgi:hypothetical protein
MRVAEKLDWKGLKVSKSLTQEFSFVSGYWFLVVKKFPALYRNSREITKFRRALHSLLLRLEQI